MTLLMLVEMICLRDNVSFMSSVALAYTILTKPFYSQQTFTSLCT